MKETLILLKKSLKPENPPDASAHKCFEKSLSDELFLMFPSRVQNFTVLSIVYMIRIRFFRAAGINTQKVFGRMVMCTAEEDIVELNEIHGPLCWQGCEDDHGVFKKLMWCGSCRSSLARLVCVMMVTACWRGAECSHFQRRRWLFGHSEEVAAALLEGSEAPRDDVLELAAEVQGLRRVVQRLARTIMWTVPTLPLQQSQGVLLKLSLRSLQRTAPWRDQHSQCRRVKLDLFGPEQVAGPIQP